jgi:dihydroxyacetone kinase-like predicted kinase
MSKKEKYFEKNSNLAFNLTIKLLGDYAEKCQVDSDKNMMDPILGTYNLVNQLAIGLLYKADGHIDDAIDIMNIAIQDAKEIVENTKEAS